MHFGARRLRHRKLARPFPIGPKMMIFCIMKEVRNPPQKGIARKMLFSPPRQGKRRLFDSALATLAIIDDKVDGAGNDVPQPRVEPPMPKGVLVRKIQLIGVTAALMLALGACAAIPRPGPVGNRAVPEPAKSVDLRRYMGRWYEQFRYEASFQKGFEAVTADYALNADGTVKVINRGLKGGLGGALKQSTGKAKVADAATNAKLKVSFFGPFYGDYWVLDHDDDYEWSIVGEPSGRYLWALTRAQEPTAAVLRRLEERVKSMGYDWSLVRMTKQ